MLKSMLKRSYLALPFVPTLAMAQAGALETAADSAIDAGATTASNLLIAALAIVIAFFVFKIVKRAISRA